MENAKKFYNSKVWKQQRQYVWLKQNCLCAVCKQPVYVSGISDETITKASRVKGIVHHKKWLTDKNITDDATALDEDNLIGLCINCHNAIHKPSRVIRSDLMFDENGQVIPKNVDNDAILKLIEENERA